MEEEGFFPIREKQPLSVNGTRSTFGSFPDRQRRAATPLDAVPTRQSPPILDRFHLLLRERDEELRALDGEEPPPLSTEEVVRMYEEVLSELTVNSKPIITELTIIAGEQRDHAEGIADAICSRIFEVSVEHKLPALYLLDSIVKNIGCRYVRYFAARLPEVFFEVYTQVSSSLYPAMHHLFRTWSNVFPPPVLGKIEAQFEFTSEENKKLSGAGSRRETESPSRPVHGIHVNPKYLEARRQLEHSDLDAQHPRKRLSSMDAIEEKSLSKYQDYNLGPSDIFVSSVSARSSPSRATPDNLSSISETGKANSFQEYDLIRSSSREALVRQENILHHAVKRPQEIRTIHHELPTEFSNNRPRALIEAYGSNKSSNIHHDMPSMNRMAGDDRIGTDTAVRKWENSEEEEYLWDDMSPTLADRSKSMKLAKYDTHHSRYGIEARLRQPDSSILDANLNTNSWSLSSQPLGDEHYAIHDEREAMIGLGRRLRNEDHHVAVEKSESVSFIHGRDSRMADHLQLSKIPALSSVLPAVSRRFRPFPNPADGDTSMRWSPNVQSDAVNIANVHSFPESDNKYMLQRVDFPPNHSMGHLRPRPSLQSFATPLYPFQSADQLNSVGLDNSIPRHGIGLSFSSPAFFPDNTDSDSVDSRTLMSAHRESAILYPLTQQNRGSIPLPQSQPREPHGNNLPSSTVHISGQAAQPQGQLADHISSSSSQLLSSLSSGLYPLSQISGRVSGNSNITYSGALPPLAPGTQTISQIGNSAAVLMSKPGETGYIGLISSLMSKGMIKLPPVTGPKEYVGIEFNPDHLKVRHDSVVDSLYANLPRQCTTCGLRFKCQEEHSTHMDWHVTKNRISKNRKQKPSRKWFVSAKEWLSGAETLGADAAPGFLPSETVTERKEDMELAVPADVNQNLCALCGEPFEEFYSDEADEWMYKGAVYLNAPEGYVEELDRSSQLGPIVHAKCNSKSSYN